MQGSYCEAGATANNQELSTYSEALPLRSSASRRKNDLKTLHGNPELWLRVKMYHHDLKHFSSDPAAARRLSNTHQPLFMSDCYFSEDERGFLLQFCTATGTPLREIFDEMNKSSGSSVVCSSHDLAPIIERVFGIRKGYELEKQFIGGRKRFRKAN